MKHLALTEKDRAIAAMLKRARVLEHVDGQRFDRGGVALVYCGDCDQSPEYLDHFHRTICASQAISGFPRVHQVTRNGGAIRFCRNSPANKRGRTTYLDCIDELAETCDMKEISQIALTIHAPCGKCRACGINYYQATQLLMQAKVDIKADLPRALQKMRKTETAPRISVACFCPINWGEGNLTYFSSRQKYLRWIGANREEIKAVLAA